MLSLPKYIKAPTSFRRQKSGRRRWTEHLQRSQNDRIKQRVWEEPPIGKIPLGRPRLRWRDNIIKDLVIAGLDQPEWREMTHDRSRSRQIIKATKTHPGL